MEHHEFKINKIHALTKEVNELHPVLKDLLPKLPNISKVDHTHGTNEMGADFVVTLRDPTLDSEEYVGLIVKCGNISQAYDDIERQIKECVVPRKIDGGKKNIYLNQIWIVSNGSISENAKKKIYEEHRSKNVKFIWDERLVSLIDKHYPEYWEDVDKNVGIYLSAVSRQIENLNKSQSLLEIASDSFYIEQDISKIDPENRKKFLLRSKNAPTKLSTALAKDRFIFVEAGMGYGKSRLLREATIEYCNHQKFSERGVLPVFITFRDLVELHNNSLNNILEDLSQKKKVEAKNYTLLFVIDSVDEIKGDAQNKAKTISEFITQLMPNENMRVVIASRPFEDPLADQVLDGCVTRYALQPLSMQKLLSFIDKLCAKTSITSRLKSDLQKSDLFKSLPKTPISAILLGRVLNAEHAKELPSTLPELYSKYLELALGRWAINKGKSTEKEYDTTVIIVRKIAKYMFENNLPEIGIGDAKAIVNEYLALRETGQNSEQIFANISNCTEVFSIDEIQNKLFFRHRTFLEFMYAEKMFIKHGKSAKIERPFDGYWGAVNFFYLGKLKDCPEQLSAIFDIIPESEHAQISKIYQSGSYLLAAYQSPYSSIIDCLRKTFLDAADLYCRICEEPTKSRLGKLPELQLLAVMTALMRNTFEYSFFERALTDVETDVMLSIDNDKRKAVAAFFIASVRAGLGNNDAFTMLIEEHLSNLPHALKFGITHASEDADVTNDALNRLEKKMSRAKKGNPAISKAIYNIPLDERKDPRLS